MNKEVVQQRIQNICDKLSIQENADTMLFLAHLSKNSMIVDFLLLAARKVFPLTIPTDLGEDIGFLKDIGDVAKDIPKLYAERREPEEVRKHNARNKDHKDERNGNEPTGKENSDSPKALEQRIAFNLIQIMGQLLKNYPYALEKDVKRDLVEQSCLLGLRALKDVFNEVEEALTYIMTNYIDKSIYKVDDASNHTMALQKLETDFKKYAFVLAGAITQGYTAAISDMIFVKDLSETYKATSQKNNTTAFDLVHAALQLKQNLTEMQWNHVFVLYEKLSKSNPLAATVLRYMVYQNLMLFPPNRDSFQKICDRLSISRQQQIKLKQESPLL